MPPRRPLKLQATPFRMAGQANDQAATSQQRREGDRNTTGKTNDKQGRDAAGESVDAEKARGGAIRSNLLGGRMKGILYPVKS